MSTITFQICYYCTSSEISVLRAPTSLASDQFNLCK